jgi:hypothetical protein
MLDRLQDVLRLAGACPRGESGNAIRRAACEMIEADSAQQRRKLRLQMMKIVAQAHGGGSAAGTHASESGRAALAQLSDALRDEFHEA